MNGRFAGRHITIATLTKILTAWKFDFLVNEALFHKVIIKMKFYFSTIGKANILTYLADTCACRLNLVECQQIRIHTTSITVFNTKIIYFMLHKYIS